ncbi:MAG: hypothetical protein PHU46_13960 [Rhodocyclaceae bacterium]|nr:hypothetical protein [Rhodocyclaceae bacterium]
MSEKLLALFVLLAGLALPATGRAEDYRLGQGVFLGENLILSGYANLVFEVPHGAPATLSVDDLSLFVSARVNRWLNPFVEIEVSGAQLATQGDAPRVNGYLIPERLYNDARVTESDTLRVGKMLSPVGDWNLVHAAPLVPTATRPLSTYWGFSEYISGLSWLHAPSEGRGPDWQVYWQPGRELAERPDAIAPRHYRNVWGAHVNWPMGLVDKLGVSLQRGQLASTGDYYTLLGANARKTFGRLRLEGEAVSSRRSCRPLSAHCSEWGGYGLADYAFTSRWHGLLEWETYQDHLVERRSRNALLGIAYKPESYMVWKLEYVHQYGESQNIPTGWQASFSVLF